MTPTPPLRRLRLVLVLLAFCPAVPRGALAGAWPAPEDGGGVVFNVLPTITRLQGYDRFGRPAGNGWSRQLVGSLYWEHGVTERLTMGMQPRVQADWLRDGGQTRHNYGLAETKFFARYTLYRGDWDAMSVQYQLSIPGAAHADAPRLAETNSSHELRVMYGRSFPLGQVATLFTEGSIAASWRPGPAADEWAAKLTVGVRPNEDWLVFGQMVSDFGMRNARPGGADYSIHRARVSAVYYLDPNWGLELGYVKDIAGRRISLGNAIIGGVWYNY